MLRNLKRRLKGKSATFFFRTVIWAIVGLLLTVVGTLRGRPVAVVFFVVLVAGYLACGIAARVLEKRSDDELE